MLELIITCAILLILATAAMPVARFTVKRRKEAELRRDLREMRDAIDRYKDAADRNLIRVEAGTEGYPPDLQTLVKGVDITTQPGAGALGGLAGGTVSGQSGSATAPFGSSSTSNFGSSFGSSFGQSTGAPGGLSGGSSFGSSFGAGASGFGSTSTSTGASAGTSAGTGAPGTPLIQHVRFLRHIPVDPMTGRAEWGMRSVSDDPSSTSWGGMDVFDVFSLSTDSALDGTRYQDW